MEKSSTWTKDLGGTVRQYSVIGMGRMVGKALDRRAPMYRKRLV